MIKLSVVSILAAVALSPVLAMADSSERMTLSSQQPNLLRQEPCQSFKYDCGSYLADVDRCADGSLYLQGTDIPFRCENGD